jgi:hypothetical protein
VTGIEEDRVQTAVGAAPGVRRAKRLGAPTPEGSDVVAKATTVREAATPPALGLDEFTAAVRARLERQ